MQKILFNAVFILSLLLLVQATSRWQTEKFPTQGELRKEKSKGVKKLPANVCNVSMMGDGLENNELLIFM